MTPSRDHEPADEIVARELDDFQRALDDGTVCEPPPENEAKLAGELELRVARAKACLAMLHKAAREKGATLALSNTSPDTPATTRIRGQPESIGRFKVLGVLGYGGFGVVYRALDPQTKRQVALKVPRLEVLSSGELLRRFEQEAEAAAKLDHPNIVPVLEAGSVGLLPYIASGYYPGTTLAHWLKEHADPVDARAAATLTLALAQAVRHAHERGVLHRDVKPSNVLLAAPDETVRASGGLGGYTPKLMDFGLAKLTESSADVTRSGAVIGTVRYMAPEQAEARAGEIGPATDIYALGNLLYELLIGRTPFVAESDAALLAAITQLEPIPPRRLRPNVPVELETICLKCLEKRPEKRYASAGALAEDLTRFLAGEPIRARPSGPVERLVKWARRKPALATLISVSALGLLALSMVVLWYNARLSRSLAATMASERLASERLLVARRYAYAADMRLLDSNWDQVPYPQLKAILDRQIPQAGEPDLRGFEWWFHANQLKHDNPWRRIGGHEGGVSVLAIQPGNEVVASGGNDGVIRLWRARDWSPIGQLGAAGGKAVNDLAFSPDGRLLACAMDDEPIHVWEVVNRTLVQTLDGHGEWASVARFSPDGTTLATSGADKRIALWDAGGLTASSPATKRGELLGHSDTIRAMAFHPTLPLLFSSAEDATIRAWDTDGMAPSARVPDGHLANPTERWCRRLAVFPEEESLLGVLFGDLPVAWSLGRKDFGKVAVLEGNRGHVRSASFLHDPQGRPLVALGSEEAAIGLHVYPRLTSVQRNLIGHAGSVEALASPVDGKWLLSGDATGALFAWDLARRPGTIREFQCANLAVFQLALSPRGDRAAAVIDHGTLILVDLPAESAMRVVDQLIRPQVRLEFTPEGDTLLVLEDTGKLSAYPTTVPGPPRHLAVMDMARTLAVSPDGREAAVGGDGRIALVDLDAQVVRATIPVTGSVFNLAFVDPDHFLATTGTNIVTLCDRKSGAVAREYPLPNADIRVIAVHPAGEFAAAGGHLAAYILELATGNVLDTLPQGSDCSRLVFLGNGTSLAATDARDRTRIWSVATWQDVASFDRLKVGAYFHASRDGWRILFGTGRKLSFLDARPR